VNPAERDIAILSLGPLVEMLACRRKASLPISVRIGDLIQAGWLGAIFAVDHFEPERDNLLATYAEWRIRGAMVDYLRDEDWASRDHRKAIQRGDEQPPKFIRLDHPETVDRIPKAFSFIDGRGVAERKRIDARLLLKTLYARAHLDPRAVLIVKRCTEGEEQKRVGRSLGVTEGRISQILKRSIAKLRAAA
jgi:RNA polymerase sigma factor (sigma-70 family)